MKILYNSVQHETHFKNLNVRGSMLSEDSKKMTVMHENAAALFYVRT